MKGRGSETNPSNRFEELRVERDDSWQDEEANLTPGSPLQTRFCRDRSQSIIVYNDSPDVGGASFNPYRGCEHGCAYCYARPGHEYLGLSAGLDFETKIFVKTDAPALLRRALAAPSWKPQTLMVSGVTDCYQPVERRLQITRQCLEVLAEFRNPVGLITKNALVMRDLDWLAALAEVQAAAVTLSVTTLSDDLVQVLEPRTSRPKARLAAIRALAQAGVPVGINIAPVIPGLTDHEIPAILEACREAGAQYAGYIVLRLPYGVKDLFDEWLRRCRPLAREKILHRIREVRGGRLYDARWGRRQTGEGRYAEQIGILFRTLRRKLGYAESFPALSTRSFRRSSSNPNQLDFFDV